MEMDTNSFYWSLAFNSFEDSKQAELKKKLGTLSKKTDCSNEFSANSTSIFFSQTFCQRHFKHKQRGLGLFKEVFWCSGMICVYSKTYCCFDKGTDEMKFRSKGLNKRTLEETGAWPLEKYRYVLDKKTNVQPKNWGWRAIQHSVCTYEQTKRRLSQFYPKRIVLNDGIHTESLLLYINSSWNVLVQFYTFQVQFCKLLHYLFSQLP